MKKWILQIGVIHSGREMYVKVVGKGS